MPFTLAHPAIILPLSRYSKYFSFSALVIGSLAPDFEYFLRFNITSTFGHSVLGAFIIDLPLVFVVSFLFYKLMVKPILTHLPYTLNRTFNFETGWHIHSFRSFIIFTYSAILGIFSHIFWDAFTHADGLFVKNIEWMRTNTLLSIPVYNFLQHLSTVLGMLLIAIFVYQNSTKQPTQKMTRIIPYWTSVTVTSVVLFFCVTALIYNEFSLKNWSNHLVSLMSCSFIGLLIVSTVYTLKNLPDKRIS